ncbi:MAG: UDP-3-O-acyl-N-acetylglucosamine deacetylase, partial [Planctomycetota bacterium]
AGPPAPRPAAAPPVERRPAAGGIGVLGGHLRSPASAAAVSGEPVVAALGGSAARHTVLAGGGARVITTEHALAALAGLGVTDADIVLSSGQELPIDDGSAACFVRAIDAAGLVEPGGTIDPLVVRGPVSVDDGRGGVIHAEPAAAADYHYSLDYGAGAPVLPQRVRWSGDAARFRKDIAPARTFSLRAEAEAMRAAGLFTAFTPADLPVVDDDGSLIDNDWRFDDEPARHKLLDLIGDLALVGRPILGRVMASRSGHALNHEMARTLLDRFG